VFVLPRDSGLSGRELAVYELIWKRTMATQMAEAQKLSVVVHIESKEAVFSTSGSRILFPGFLRAYVEGSDDPDAALEDKEVVLPKMAIGEELTLKVLSSDPHETKPPARFTEASLVQTLEKEGIGRPSTYASIIGTIQDRKYVKRQGTALIPTFTGFAVAQFLDRNFKHLVDPGFTSKMEESLDDIANGDKEWLPYLKQFYLGKEGLQNLVKTQDKSIDPDESRTIEMAQLKDVLIKVGRYGPYIVREGEKVKGKKATEEVHASIPEDMAPADLKAENIEELLEISKKGPQSIGTDPATRQPIFVLLGRFGPYVQLGEVTEAQPKPKRGSLPKDLDPKAVTLEKALEILSLPRDLGVHPTTGKPILTNNGRFGPYVVHDGDFRSLKKEDNVYTVTLERALELISAPKKSRAGSTVLKELGQHPTDKKPVQVLEGKYGPYVKHGSNNVTIPKGIDPNSVTLDEAVNLLKTKSKKK
jgi:DNA topoisomerase-1